MVNPQELQNADFSKGFKGYTCAEVDKYIEYVLEQYTELYREHAELEKKVKILYAKLEEAKNDQNSISATIVNAQKMADEIVKDANDKANAINAAIKSSFDDIVEKYRIIIDREQRNLFQAQKDAIEFKVGILDGYKQQVRSLCELIPLDSVDDVNMRSVDEVVESAISTAGAKLGVRTENDNNEAEVESDQGSQSDEN